MRCKFLFLLILSLYPWLPNAAQIESPDQNGVLARIGPRSITGRDLLERIELMPWPGKDQPSMHDSAVTNALLSLVAEKLLSLEASRLGVGQDEGITAGFTTLERAFARDELFRQEILGQVRITPEEIDQALRRYTSELTLAVFAVSSESDARALVLRLMTPLDTTGRAFPRLTVHSQDTVTITFGALVPAHEDVAYGIRDLLNARASYTVSSGWLVFRLLDRRPNPAAMRLSLVNRRTTVENVIRKRRQAELTVHYYNRYIGGEEIRMDSALFHAVADTLLALKWRDKETHQKGTSFGVTGADVENLLKAFAEKGDVPFVSLRSDTVRLRAFLRGMGLHSVQLRSLYPKTFKEDFNRATMTVAEAELMSELALRQHYNDHSDVRRDLSAWREATQTKELVGKIVDSLLHKQDRDSSLTGSNTRAPIPDADEPLDKYIARLANKYGVEIDFQKVRELKVVPFNMVTRRYIGFGGTVPAVPLLPHLWDWYESWKKEGAATP